MNPKNLPGQTKTTRWNTEYFAWPRTNCLHVVYGGEPLQMLCNLRFTIHNRLHKLAVKLTMTAGYQTDRFETKKWSAVNWVEQAQNIKHTLLNLIFFTICNKYIFHCSKSTSLFDWGALVQYLSPQMAKLGGKHFVRQQNLSFRFFFLGGGDLWNFFS